MDSAFVITWKVPIAGREQQALQLGAEADEYWGRLASEGKCSTPEWFFFPNGTGMWMVKGERRDLEEAVEAEDGRRLLVKGMLLLQDWQYALTDTGSRAQRFMTDYAGELGRI